MSAIEKKISSPTRKKKKPTARKTVLKSTKDITALIRNAQARSMLVYMWQNSSITGDRNILKGLVTAIRPKENRFEVHLHASPIVPLTFDDPIFFYIRGESCLFKTNVVFVKNELNLCIVLPKVIRHLEDSVSDQEKARMRQIIEEKNQLQPEQWEVEHEKESWKFAQSRSTPRFMALKDHQIYLAPMDKDKKVGDISQYRLYDLSRGGAGLLARDKNDFKEGDRVYINAIGDQGQRVALEATVRNVIPLEHSQPLFKVGLKFWFSRKFQFQNKVQE